jgi:DNA-binding PadR family transcriptional regulator
MLLALADGPLHGYGIKQAVEERTHGSIRLGSGTLYEAIARLLDCGYIEEVSQPARGSASGGPPRRFYAMTSNGRKVLVEELRRMNDVIRSARARELLREEGGG